MAEQLRLISFLEKIKNESIAGPCVCFSSTTEYPLLFFSRVINYLKKNHSMQIQSIDSVENDNKQILGQLETTFLGIAYIYWLRDVSSLSASAQQFWYDYCINYKGPNVLWLFAMQDIQKKLCPTTVMLPTYVDEQLFIQLAAFFDIPLTTSNRMFIKKICTYQANVLSLDNACLMLEYMQLVGTDNDIFFDQIVYKLMPSEVTLFALSSAFMAKKKSLFYAQWKKLESLYSEQFWCSFFSDLLWRGAEYIRLAQNQDMIGARKIAYRLPFSFIKSDWRLSTNKELIQAHAYIYDADFRFKNSGGYAAFDLFFSSFFLNSFDNA